MKLLLDEHYPKELAAGLRDRGYDVVAICERIELRGGSDQSQLGAACDEGRAIVTEDVSDFRRLLADATRAGSETYGLVCVRHSVFARKKGEIGRLLAALDALLTANPGDDDLARKGGEIWLEPADAG